MFKNMRVIDIVVIFWLLLLTSLIIWKNMIEPLDNTDVQLKNSIKNLAVIAKTINEDGNLTIEGNLNVKGNISTDGTATVKKSMNVYKDIYGKDIIFRNNWPGPIGTGVGIILANIDDFFGTGWEKITGLPQIGNKKKQIYYFAPCEIPYLNTIDSTWNNNIDTIIIRKGYTAKVNLLNKHEMSENSSITLKFNSANSVDVTNGYTIHDIWSNSNLKNKISYLKVIKNNSS